MIAVELIVLLLTTLAAIFVLKLLFNSRVAKLDNNSLDELVKDKLPDPPDECYWEVQKFSGGWYFEELKSYHYTTNIPKLRLVLINPIKSLQSAVTLPLVDRNNNVLSKKQIERDIIKNYQYLINNYNIQLIVSGDDRIILRNEGTNER